MSGSERDSGSASDRWRELAAKELRGADPDTLVWTTPEGIPVKPLYTAADLEDLEAVGSLPGFDPARARTALSVLFMTFILHGSIQYR